jgi:hypothetical protein
MRNSKASCPDNLIRDRPCSVISRSGSRPSSRGDTPLWVFPALDIYYAGFKQSGHFTTKLIYIMERSEEEWTALNI